ncbi:MAG: PilZ domain-containing protein [Lachnospiraceae bacterium]|jgi:NurA-like 5'-3' nuclease|nr:PilZ domain-containing protein [Lachnospiraceae bacterium]
MQERRRAKRMPVKLSLEISNLYKQDNEQVRNINAPIEVVNISKTGIGFQSESELPIGYYFNANINLNEGDTLHCVVKIIRSQPLEENRKIYGCEFVGMAAILSYIFDEYDRKITEESEMDKKIEESHSV